MLPRLQPGERAFITGPTGSGKSELAAALLKPLNQRIIVISPKNKFEWASNDPRFQRVAHSTLELGQQLREDRDFPTRAYRLYAPATDYNAQNIHKIDRVFEWALQLGNTCVVVDDFYLFGGGASSHREVEQRSPNYIMAVTQGRDPQQVTVVSIAQRPSNIPKIAYTEADLRATFYLRDPEDQARMDKYCGAIPWDELKVHDYSFVWATDKHQSGITRLDLRPMATA